jgi:hypothetical protein
MKIELDDDLITKLVELYASADEPLTDDKGLPDHDSIVEVVEDYVERGLKVDFQEQL